MALFTAKLAHDTGSLPTDGITNLSVISGTADANAVITVMEGLIQLGFATSDSFGNWTFTPSPALLDGNHTLTVSETNATTLVTSTAFVRFTLDTVAQPAVITSVIGSGTLTTVSGTGEVGSILTLLDGTTVIGTTTVRSDGSWALAPTLALGSHQLSLQETDLAGNTAKTVAQAFIVGTPAPDLTAASDAGQSSTDNITNVAKPLFTGSGFQTGATVQLFDNGTTSLGSGVVDALGNWTITGSVLLDGVHSVTVKQTFAGTTSAASAALLVTIDTALPAVPSKPSLTTVSDTGSSSSDNITKDLTPTFSGTAEAGSLVRLFDSVTVGTGKTAVTTVTEISSITAAADGTWTTPSSVTLGQQGLNTISATATDVAGNVSVPSATQKITIDSIAPVPVISSMVLNKNGNGSVVLTGSVEAGAVVTVFDLATNLGTATNNAGTWTFTTAATLTDTLHVFILQATDVAGNVSTITGQNGSAQFGSTQDDLIKSTIGNDIMTGGAGNDTFSFLSDFGKDVITDFTTGSVIAGHDTINFHSNPLLASFASVTANAKQVGVNTVITQGANTLTLDGVQAKSLISADFTFA